MRLVFDIETNGLLEQLDRIHIIVAEDIDTGAAYDFGPDAIDEGIALLMQADWLGGHNIIKFDIPAIQKIYPDFNPKAEIFDTLVASRLIWSNLSDRDHAMTAKGKGITGKMVGSHALGAWGQRLGEAKGDYEGSWEHWNQEMHDYAIQDAVVTNKLWKLIDSKGYSKTSLDLEMRVAEIMARCERKGFAFDVTGAEALTNKLIAQRAQLEVDLQDSFKPWYSKVEEVTPKRSINYKNKAGVVAGASYTKVKLNIFNAGSRQHIANRLQALFGWKPTDWNANGTPKVDETTLAGMQYPEAQLLGSYLLLVKRLGQLAEGKQAWLNVQSNGRIHATYMTNQAVTGRAVHRYPNIAQVPSVGALYGKECRELFTVTKGRKLVGVDLSGLELRCLSHFMSKWDEGAYGEELLKGDIHTANMKAAGLDDRQQAKGFIYGFLYGAGAEKLGSMVGGNRSHGQRLKDRFLSKTPALANLIAAVQSAAKKGYLKGLDGRQVYVRHQHAALNTLLQSAGALLAKAWLVEIDKGLKAAGIADRVDLVAWVHDEVQMECDNDIAEKAKCIAEEAAVKAGEFFDFRIIIEAEGTIGNNWSDTH